MERLTEHSKQTSHENGICCTHFRGPECLEVGGNCAMNCKWEEAAWSRLAAYEDTERTPEEVTALGNLFDYVLEESKTLTGQLALLNRIRDLAEADKDGRLVVLPCKVGDTVWRIKRTFEEYPDRSKPYIEPSGFLLQDIFNICKTVFLTREEAEAALEAMK